MNLHSFVNCMRRRRGLRCSTWMHNEYRRGALAQHGACDTAEDSATNASAPVAGHHDQVGYAIRRGDDYATSCCTDTHLGADPRTRVLLEDLRLDAGQVTARLARQRLLLLIQIRQHIPKLVRQELLWRLDRSEEHTSELQSR